MGDYDDLEVEVRLGRVQGQTSTLHLSIVGTNDASHLYVLAMDDHGRRQCVGVRLGRTGLSQLRQILDRVEAMLAQGGTSKLAP